jgi:HlyD family secretion protein
MLEPGQERVADGLDALSFVDEVDSEILAPVSTRLSTRVWWQRRWVALTAGILLFALLAGAVYAVIRLRTSQTAYTTYTVATGDLALTVHATGALQTATYAVNFTGSGTIATIDVKVGQQVTAGQTLATMNATSLQDAVAQAQAQVNAAQTALNDAQTNQSKVQAQTQAQLAAAYDVEQGKLADSTCNSACQQQAQDTYAAAQAQADTQNAQAQAQVDSAQSALNTSQSALNTAQHNLDNATLTAPHDGTVAAINGAVGGSPGGGGTSGTTGGNAFITLVDLSALQVQASVNEADIGAVAAGDAVQFTVSAFSGRVFHGTVDSVSPLGQTSSGVVTYPVVLNVDTSGLQGVNLLPGMTASATIITAQRYNVLLIPAKAVSFASRATSASGGNLISSTQMRSALSQANALLQQLRDSGTDISNENPTPAFVLERKNGKWVIKPVVLGLTDGISYEVLAGLSQGEKVVTGVQGASSASHRNVNGVGFAGGSLFSRDVVR